MTRSDAFINWGNATFTGVIAFGINHDTFIEVCAFMFVTLPLGYLQWTAAIAKWRERQAKKQNGQSNS
jgi:hypothetical protein